MNTPLKEQSITKEITEDLQGLWRTSENLIDTPKYNQKPPEFMVDIYSTLQHTFTGWTWKQVRNAWMKMNTEIARHPDITKTDLQHRAMSVGFLTAQLPRHAVSDANALPSPKTEAELELDALRRKWEGMTEDERIQAKIDQLGECPKENLDRMLISASSDVFKAMKSRMTADEIDEFDTDAWSRWANYMATYWHKSVDKYKDLDIFDRWEISFNEIVLSMTRGNAEKAKHRDEIRAKMKLILREELHRIYFRITR